MHFIFVFLLRPSHIYYSPSKIGYARDILIHRFDETDFSPIHTSLILITHLNNTEKSLRHHFRFRLQMPGIDLGESWNVSGHLTHVGDLDDELEELEKVDARVFVGGVKFRHAIEERDALQVLCQIRRFQVSHRQ